MKPEALPSILSSWVKPLTMTLLILLVAVFGRYFYTRYDLIPPNLESPPTWRGITPGETRLQQAFDLLGSIGDAEMRDPSCQNSFWTYRYTNPEEYGWGVVELWAQDEEGERIVQAVYFSRAYSSSTDPLPETDESHLGLLVGEYGRPDKVTWSTGRLGRVLMWPRHGVMADADANVEREGFALDEAKILEMVLFEPMGLRKTLRIERQWPWPYGSIRSLNNMYTEAPGDWLPEDPYDWSLVPSS
jgi:hypothetical protein